MVGFDLGTLGFKIAELKRRFGRFYIVGQNQATLSTGIINRNGITQQEIFSRSLTSALLTAKPKPVRSRELIAALPESFIYTKSITLPTGNAKEARKTLQYTLEFEAAEIFPISPEDAYIDYMITDSAKQSTTILVVAAPKAIVDSFSEVVNTSGYQLLGIETKALALARLFLDPPKKQAVILSDIGAKVSKLSIFHDNQLMLNVTTAVGAIDLRKKTENFRRLAREISNTVTFYQHKYNQPNWQAERMIISGGGAHVPEVDRKLSKILSIACEIGKPIMPIEGYDPQFAVTYGLALSRP